MAVGFGRNYKEAGLRAKSSLLKNFNMVIADYTRQWKLLQADFMSLAQTPCKGTDLYRVSTAVLKLHESKRFPGGIIASLSIPWGPAKGDNDTGGYHLVWSRDLVETAEALIAAGNTASANQTLAYLMATQDKDGHWFQNMWLDGAQHWTGIQMDEVAFPILLADSLRRQHSLNGLNPWLMVKKAASYITRNGPVTQEDGWDRKWRISTVYSCR